MKTTSWILLINYIILFIIVNYNKDTHPQCSMSVNNKCSNTQLNCIFQSFLHLFCRTQHLLLLCGENLPENLLWDWVEIVRMLHLSYFLTVHWFVIWAVVNDSTEHGTDFMMVQSILFLSVSSKRFSKKLYQEYIKTFKTFKVILKKEKTKFSMVYILY